MDLIGENRTLPPAIPKDNDLCYINFKNDTLTTGTGVWQSAQIWLGQE